MANTIHLHLLDNKTIVADEIGYKIIAGEENATNFLITSVPNQYKNARFTVEMVNSKGQGVEETTINNNRFSLPLGMAVAGYSKILIRAYLNNETVPWEVLKLKVENTLPNWEEGITNETGGVSNYELLTNKPKINGVELVGDISTDDLNIVAGGIESATSGLPTIDENYTTTPITFNQKDGTKINVDVYAKNGENGISPHIGDNGNWFIGDTDTGVSATGGGTASIDEVDASKVIFPETVYTSYAVGNIVLENGLGVMAYEGESLLDRDKRVWLKEMTPTITQPSVSITFSQAKAYEVGTKVTPSYSASFSAGTYQYGTLSGTGTGVTVSSWSVKDTNNVTKTTSSGSFAELQVIDGISYKITATANHTAGLIPITNTKNEYPEGQIAAGSKSATSGAITGYRNTFYGTLTAKTDLTSSVIRGLSNKSNASLANGSSFTVTIPVGALRVVIAYPATLRDVNSIKDVNGLNAEIKTSFIKSTISVEGANNYSGINYKVYVLDYAEANATANKYTVQI